MLIDLAIILGALAVAVAGYAALVSNRRTRFAEAARADWLSERAKAEEAVERAETRYRGLKLNAAASELSGDLQDNGREGNEAEATSATCVAADWAGGGAAETVLAQEAAAAAKGAEAASAERAANAARLARCKWMAEVSDAAAAARQQEIVWTKSAANLSSVLFRRAEAARAEWMRERANAEDAVERAEIRFRAWKQNAAGIGFSSGPLDNEWEGSAADAAFAAGVAAEWAVEAPETARAEEAAAVAKDAEAVSADKAANAVRLARGAWTMEVSDAAAAARQQKVLRAASAARLNSAAARARALAGQDLGWAKDIAFANEAAVKAVLRVAQIRFLTRLRWHLGAASVLDQFAVARAIDCGCEVLEVGRQVILAHVSTGASHRLDAEIIGLVRTEIAASARARARSEPGSPGPGRISDIRLKRDIVRLGRLENGIGLYRFRYRGDDPTLFVGVIAQDVQRVMPGAVVRGDDGYLRVDYRHLPLRLMTWDEWRRMGRRGSDYFLATIPFVSGASRATSASM